MALTLVSSAVDASTVTNIPETPTVAFSLGTLTAGYIAVVIVHTSTALTGNPAVTLGGQSMTRVSWSSGDEVAVFTRTVDGTESSGDVIWADNQALGKRGGIVGSLWSGVDSITFEGTTRAEGGIGVTPQDLTVPAASATGAELSIYHWYGGNTTGGGTGSQSLPSGLTDLGHDTDTSGANARGAARGAYEENDGQADRTSTYTNGVNGTQVLTWAGVRVTFQVVATAATTAQVPRALRYKLYARELPYTLTDRAFQEDYR